MFPDYGADLPLWGQGLLSVDSVGLSEGLISDLRAWVREWEAGNPPMLPSLWSDRQRTEWKQRGYRLAAHVQAELPDADIQVDNDQGELIPLRQLWGQD